MSLLKSGSKLLIRLRLAIAMCAGGPRGGRDTPKSPRNGPVTLLRQPMALARKEHADVGTGDGLQCLSRARARLRARQDLPDPPR
jgi:hypothetical protein